MQKTLTAAFAALLLSANIASATPWTHVSERRFEAHLLKTPQGILRLTCDTDTVRAGQFMQIELHGAAKPGAYKIQIGQKSISLAVAREIIVARWTLPSVNLAVFGQDFASAEDVTVTGPDGSGTAFKLGNDRPAWCL